MKILAFGASTSASSINRQFATHAASQVKGAKVTDLDLRDLEVPLFSVDEEEANGVPQNAQKFLDLIQQHDALVVSLAEHNGSYSAAFKNLYDWASRIHQKVWSDKPMLLLSTSPGPRGGASVMEAAKATFPRMGAKLVAHFSLPSFYENFSSETGIKDTELNQKFGESLAALGQ